MGGLLVFAFVACVVSIISGSVGAYVSGVRGRPQAEGAVLGALFGPLGVLIAVLMPAGQMGSGGLSSDGPDEEDATDERALSYVGGVATPAPDLNVLDQIGGARLTPEERAKRDEKGIDVLRARVKVDHPDAPRP